jgi:hypothetical protein
MLLQVPSVPLKLQERQADKQSLLQQNPSTQKPL